VESGGASKHTADASGLQAPPEASTYNSGSRLLTAPTHHTSPEAPFRRIGVGGGELGELRGRP